MVIFSSTASDPFGSIWPLGRAAIICTTMVFTPWCSWASYNSSPFCIGSRGFGMPRARVWPLTRTYSLYGRCCCSRTGLIRGTIWSFHWVADRLMVKDCCSSFGEGDTLKTKRRSGLLSSGVRIQRLGRMASETPVQRLAYGKCLL